MQEAGLLKGLAFSCFFGFTDVDFLDERTLSAILARTLVDFLIFFDQSVSESTWSMRQQLGSDQSCSESQCNSLCLDPSIDCEGFGNRLEPEQVCSEAKRQGQEIWE